MIFGHCAGKLQRIHNDERIFLYSNGNGIKAMGVADGNVHTHFENGRSISMKYLDQFQILNVSLTVARIKEITRANFPYMQAIFSLRNRIGELI